RCAFSNPVLAAVASRVFANRSMPGPSRGLRESITLQNLNVIRPLERGWVRQVLLTHATADFRDRGKLPRSEKPDKSIEQSAHVVDAVTQQRRGGHHRVGASEQVFVNLVRRFDAGARGERYRDTPGQDRDPKERQPDLGGRAQFEI